LLIAESLIAESLIAESLIAESLIVESLIVDCGVPPADGGATCRRADVNLVGTQKSFRNQSPIRNSVNPHSASGNQPIRIPQAAISQSAFRKRQSANPHSASGNQPIGISQSRIANGRVLEAPSAVPSCPRKGLRPC
jgi:hypothetical protein